MELKPEHITPYFPFKLKMLNSDGEIYELTSMGISMNLVGQPNGTYLTDPKLILKPLSDYKDASGEAMGRLDGRDFFNQLEISELARGFLQLKDLHYSSILIMRKNHIDMLNLIPIELAVNFKTLNNG